jgi:hypothetical protein
MPNNSLVPHRRTGRPRGPPKGSANAFKHGLRQTAFVEHRRVVVAMIREARALVRKLR